MFKSITEDNKTIEDWISYIDKKVIELRKNKNIDEEILNSFHKLYLDAIGPWMQNNFLHGIEADAKLESQIISDLTDLISYLNKL